MADGDGNRPRGLLITPPMLWTALGTIVALTLTMAVYVWDYRSTSHETTEEGLKDGLKDVALELKDVSKELHASAASRQVTVQSYEATKAVERATEAAKEEVLIQHAEGLSNMNRALQSLTSRLEAEGVLRPAPTPTPTPAPAPSPG